MTILQKFIEIRAFIDSIEATKEKLLSLGSSLQGEYAFHDHIYRPNNHEEKLDLNHEFIRIRVYEKTNWNQKAVELVHKIKSIKGMSGTAKVKEEFDFFEEAEAFLGEGYTRILTFKRDGTEYKLNNLRLFVENIEGLPPSIEVIAPSQPELDALLEHISPTKIISDSVPKLIESCCKRVL